MLYLIDADVLIRAHHDHYPIDRVPQFWQWLISEGTNGYAKVPFEIYEEISNGNDQLAKWISTPDAKGALILEEEVNAEIFNHVLDNAYAPDLSDTELEEAGRDPFLITYALMGDDRRVVTREVSKTRQTRGRRRIPDACNTLNIRWMNDFRFYRERNFRTI